MLKVTRIVEAKTNKNDAKDLLVSLHLTNCTDSLLAGTFAVQDFVLGAHLLAICPKDCVCYKEGTTDLDTGATIAKMNDALKEHEMPTAYGFSVGVGELIEGAVSIKIADREISVRNIVGVGANEQLAKVDAISRAKAQMLRQKQLGLIQVVFAESAEQRKGGE